VSEDDTALRIVSAGATVEEIAAVTAVLQAALDELTAEQSVVAAPTVSEWERSQRPLRATLTPGAGAWRSF
jgi:hypothetical protein